MPVTGEVLHAYNLKELAFGRDYLLPKPLDKRLLVTVSVAVAKAAVESGVATKIITDWEAYAAGLTRLADRIRQGRY